MGKVRTSLSLSKFDVISGAKEKVIEDLTEMIHQIQDAESLFVSSPGYQDLTESILSGQVKVYGKKSRCGRGVVPDVVFSCNSYNMNEMLRFSVMSRAEAYAMSYGLFAVLADNPAETDARRVKDLFKKRYPYSRVPHSYEISSHIHRFHDKNQRTPCLPGAPAKIDLSTCDGHYLSLSYTDQEITLKFRNLTTAGRQVSLRFTVPEGDRFQGDKISKPVVQIVNSRLVFKFTVEYMVPDITPTKVMGVDLRKVEPFVATVIDPETKHRSAPYHVRYKGRLGTLVEKEQRRRDLAYHLYERADLCDRYNRTDHADNLRTEARRVSAKATRIKHEISQCIASQVVEIADQNDSHISLENLSWLDAQGGRWPHAEIQSRIESTAKRYGLKVVKVSAKDTSRTCSHCGGQVSNNSKTRIGSCATCGFSLNRDVSASREIALRATSPSSRSRERMRSLLRQRQEKRSSAATRQPKPVTALGGIQGHTGTSESLSEATLMMVRENLDSRGSST